MPAKCIIQTPNFPSIQEFYPIAYLILPLGFTLALNSCLYSFLLAFFFFNYIWFKIIPWLVKVKNLYIILYSLFYIVYFHMKLMKFAFKILPPNSATSNGFFIENSLETDDSYSNTSHYKSPNSSPWKHLFTLTTFT